MVLQGKSSQKCANEDARFGLFYALRCGCIGHWQGTHFPHHVDEVKLMCYMCVDEVKMMCYMYVDEMKLMWYMCVVTNPSNKRPFGDKRKTVKAQTQS